MADLNVTRFVIDGKTFAIPNAGSSQKGLMSADDFNKLANISAGAEVNKVDEIQINGNAVSAVGKVVNLLFSTGATDGTIKVGEAEILVKGLAALAFKDKVSQSDLENTLLNLINNIPTLKTGLETLQGTGDGSVSKQIDDKLTAWAELTTDNEKVDTFKELINWVTDHGTEAAGYSKAIKALEALAAGIGGEEEPKTIMEAISQATGSVDFSNYFTKQQVQDGFVAKEPGKGLSQENFTSTLLAKLNGIADGAKKVT